MRNLIAALLLFFTAATCKASDHSDYIGVWQADGTPPKTIEITQDGNTYLLIDLRATDFFGKKQNPRVLSEMGPQLAVNTGAGAAPLGLTGDKNTLYFDKWKFKRIPKQDVDRVKKEIHAIQWEHQRNREQCEALGREFEAKGNEIARSGAASKVKQASQAELKRNVTARAEKIPECKSTLLLY